MDKDIKQDDVKLEEDGTTKNPLDFHYFPPRNYARSKLDPMFASTTNKATTLYTIAEIETMLKNPYSNYTKLQNVSDYLLYNNSNYSNIVDYFSNKVKFI